MRRLNLKAMIFLSRNWLTTLAETVAPATRRGAEGHVSVIFHHKHLIEACFSTLFKGIDALNVDHVARLNAVLLATCFENCVCHCYHC